ncbi:Uncharacterised protein [Escherichia coli]|jgi:hypothetical protein|nr:Uncharacterised protein [Escherichia coli]SQR52359.1 Uncharacterised protein [Escherichia coli]SQS09770.1 Uncharacterised protein [Escherichia coli]
MLIEVLDRIDAILSIVILLLVLLQLFVVKRR